MASVPVVDPTGKKVATRDLSAEVFEAKVSGPLMHQVVVAAQASLRRGTHATKTRGEVSGGGKKPWRQKGTGRARQGSIRATQWKGGGKPFGPTPRSYAQAMPRRAWRAALRAALTDKLAMGQLTVVESLAPAEPKTKAMVALLRGLGATGKPTLLVVAAVTEALERGSRNIPWLTVARPNQVSVAGLLGTHRVLFEREALMRVQEAAAK
jgi:large subunit ribosomal protein L4